MITRRISIRAVVALVATWAFAPPQVTAQQAAHPPDSAAGSQPLGEPLVLHYRITDPETGFFHDRSTVTYTWQAGGGALVSWKSFLRSAVGEESELDAHFGTLGWRSRFPEDGYDYAGERSGNTLLIEGIVAGDSARIALAIDDRPFYHDWKLGLVDFVRSGEDSREFWSFRPDNQTVQVFEAKRKEEDVVALDGVEVPAVKVEWGLQGLKRIFYRGNQWYRLSDGFFLFEESSDWIVEWIPTRPAR